MVTGYLLLIAFGRQGAIGSLLDKWFGVVLAFRWTGAVLAAAVLVWRRKLFRPLGRVHYTAFAAAQVLFVAWMGYWGFFFV